MAADRTENRSQRHPDSSGYVWLPECTMLGGRYRVERTFGRKDDMLVYGGSDRQKGDTVFIYEYYPEGLAGRCPDSNRLVPLYLENTPEYEAGKQGFLEAASRLGHKDRSRWEGPVVDYFEENGTAYAAGRLSWKNAPDKRHYGAGVKKSRRRGNWDKRITVAVLAGAVFALAGTAAAVIKTAVPYYENEKEEMTEAPEIRIPNLAGMSMQEAEGNASRLGLTLEETDVLPSDYPADSIIGQTPGAGERPTADGRIKVTVSGGTEQVRIFDVAGMEEKEAIRSLKNRNLKLPGEGEIPRRYTTGEESARAAKGCVIEMVVDGAVMTQESILASQGAVITMTVSLGDYETEVPDMVVPDLVFSAVTGGRRTVTEAQALLDSFKELEGNTNHLTFRLDSKEKEYSMEVPKGQIIRQEPKAGTVEKPCRQNGRARKISVVVSKGPKLVDVPDVTGMKRKEAKKILEAEGLWFEIEEEGIYSDTVKRGRVVMTSPEAGGQLYQGERIVLYYSKGPEPTPQTEETEYMAEPEI